MTQGVPEVDTVELPLTLMRYQQAQAEVDLAKGVYREMRARFGDDDENLWVNDRGLVALTEYNFERRASIGEQRWEQTK